MFNQQQIYLFGQIQISQTGGQLHSDTSPYKVSECSQPWCSGYGRRWIFEKSWVRIQAPYVTWWMYHSSLEQFYVGIWKDHKCTKEAGDGLLKALLNEAEVNTCCLVKTLVVFLGTVVGNGNWIYLPLALMSDGFISIWAICVFANGHLSIIENMPPPNYMSPSSVLR